MARGPSVEVPRESWWPNKLPSEQSSLRGLCATQPGHCAAAEKAH